MIVTVEPQARRNEVHKHGVQTVVASMNFLLVTTEGDLYLLARGEDKEVPVDLNGALSRCRG